VVFPETITNRTGVANWKEFVKDKEAKQRKAGRVLAQIDILTRVQVASVYPTGIMK